MINIVLTKERLVTMAAFCALTVLIFIYFFSYFRWEVPVSKYEIKNTDRQRREFIESYGYTLSSDKPVKKDFRVPSEFNNSFLQFEKLQNEMGLSLIPFKGMKLKKYTYRLINTQDTAYAEIYICGKYVVAGCIVNPDLKNGYIKSF